MKKREYCAILFLINFFFAFSQESKKDTLFILTDFAKKNDLYFDIRSNIKIKFRKEKDTAMSISEGRGYYTDKIPGIKIMPQNKILLNLAQKNEINNFTIGIQKNICFVDQRVKIRDKCNIQNGIYFIHRDIDYQFLQDYNSYLDVRDSLKVDKRATKTFPDGTPRDTYGKKIMNLEILKSKHNYTDLSEFHGKYYFFDVSGIVYLVKKYKTIYIESERIDSNTVVFEKVDYQYYSDDVFP